MPNPFLSSLQGQSITKSQKALAFAIAAIADIVRVLSGAIIMGALDPMDDIIDIVVALMLVRILGFKWQIAAAFMMELIPGFAIFPTWTALVLSLPTARPEPTPEAPRYVVSRTVTAPTR